MIKEYISYKLKSTNLHGIHSPFVYELYEKVIAINKKELLPVVEKQRKKLLDDDREVEITDLGAGSKKGNSKKRRVGGIAKNAALPNKYAALLNRLVHHFKPASIIELGTSVGLTTCYLAKGNENGTVHTFEGCPNTAIIAQETFKIVGASNVVLKTGHFDTELPKHIKSNRVDFALIDGNHQKQPTLNYFNWLLEKSHENTVFVFDDIYWSKGMQKAWQEIKADNRVTVTIDLFKMGLVFLKAGQAKENFTLSF